jgi:hypothetical protein
MIRLSEKEIENLNGYQHKNAYTKGGVRIAQAQIKKIYDWGMETCPHYKVNKGIYNPMKRECEKCWTELKGE